MIALSEFFQKLAAFFQDYGQLILVKSREHLELTLIAMLIACAIAVPLGIALARCRVRLLVNIVMGLVNVIQPVPSLALVALVMTLFILIKLNLGVPLPGTGMGVGVTALVAYALLPIVRNTFTGLRQVDPTVVEVATGMGMTRRQILIAVEMPLALPVIMAGVRIATVWTIGTATLVSLVGAGGLGTLIFQGLSTYDVGLILAGTLPAIALALVGDWMLGLLERWLTPSGLREPPMRG
ncbi:MAG TPA: ABC transporter permease [Phycisphaerae bacterium]|nr:ABC transporter permease [Phycisphaerae bacterium]